MITSVLLIALPVCFGNWTANALVTERILQITFFCVLLIWQNPANMLNTNYLSFIYSFLLSLAFLLLMHVARHNFGTHITLSLGVPIETVGKMMGHMRIETTQLYAKVTDRKVDEDMKRLKAAGMDRTFGLYEEEVIVKKRRRKFGYQLSDNKETTL